jgi:hypothetical protein
MLSSRIVTVNSAKGDGDNSNFKYKIPNIFIQQYDRVVLLSATIPISFYLVQEGLNTFVLREGLSDVTITIPVGNYNTNSFKTVLKNLLNSNSPNGYTYDITMNNSFTQVDDGKFNYTCNGIIQPEFIFTTNLIEQMGFNRNTTYQFSNGVLRSSGVVNFVPEQSIFIKSDLVNTYNNSDPVLQTIYSSNEKPYSIINYQCNDYVANSKKLSNIALNYFNLVLMDENNNILKLNNRNWLCSLLFYKVDDLHKEYYNYKLLNEK